MESILSLPKNCMVFLRIIPVKKVDEVHRIVYNTESAEEYRLLFTRGATSNASRHFKSPLAMGRDAFKPKHASSVPISGVIDTGVNSN